MVEWVSSEKRTLHPSAEIQDGIPMVIDFTWELQDSGWITGELHSTVNQSGMTCTMSRSFEMKFAN